jgi:hypothetical protein
MYEDNKQKNIISIIVGLIVFIIAIQIVWHYFHTGKIVITTNNPQNIIELSKVNIKTVAGAPLQSFSARNQLSANVGLGEYTAKVINLNKSSTQLINLTSHKTLKYNMSLDNTLGFEPVASQNANDIVADNNNLTYLNPETYTLNTITSNNSSSAINSNVKFNIVKWINTSYGVGQSPNSNSLYSISGDNINKISLPSSVNINGDDSSFDVASNKQIYVASGENVSSGNQNDNFKEVYTAPTSDLVIGAASGKFAAAYSVGNAAVNDNDNVVLAVVNSSGKVKKTKVTEDVNSLSWSPNQNYLASINESSVNVYNSTLKHIALIPTTFQPGFLSWINSNELVYASSTQVWMYNIQTQKDTILANAPLDEAITYLTVNDEKSYIYLSMAGTPSYNNPEIMRIGLQGQSTSSLADQLQNILPITLSDSTIGLINFTKPSILITPNAYSTSSTASYIQEAQSQLQQDGYDISSLSFNVGPTN